MMWRAVIAVTVSNLDALSLVAAQLDWHLDDARSDCSNVTRRRSMCPMKRRKHAAEPIDRIASDRIDAQLNVCGAGGFEPTELVGQFVRRSDL